MDSWMNNVKPSDLDLGGLTLPEFDKDEILKINREIDQEQAEYKKKYGDNWFNRWWSDKNPTPDYDEFVKSINTTMYYGDVLILMGIGTSKRQQQVFDRMHEIYGDRYDELEVHTPEDPEVAEMLLVDAIKTGKWKELPDCLQEEYHKRINANIRR